MSNDHRASFETQASEAMRDALAGWRYIRQSHGDLYGVGWDRVEQKLEAALASAQAASAEPVAWNFATFNEWFEAHGKHNAAWHDSFERVKELMKLAWEVSRELTPAPAVAPAAVTDEQQPEVERTIACMDSWAKAVGLASYSELRSTRVPESMRQALIDLLDAVHTGQLAPREQAAGWIQSIVEAGEAALAARTPEPAAVTGERRLEAAVRKFLGVQGSMSSLGEFVQEAWDALATRDPEPQAERAVEWDFNLWFVELMRLADCFNEASTLASGRCRTALAAHAELAGMHWRAAAKLRDAEPQPDSRGQAREGWKLVPVEPTPEMLDKGGMEHAMNFQRVQTSDDAAGHVYRAMLAASPTPDEQRAQAAQAGTAVPNKTADWQCVKDAGQAAACHMQFYREMMGKAAPQSSVDVKAVMDELMTLADEYAEERASDAPVATHPNTKEARKWLEDAIRTALAGRSA